MKVIAIADDDSLVGHMAEESAEVLLSLGDIWDSTIERARVSYRSTTVLAVKGNHDSAAHFSSPVQDLHLKVVEVGGIRIGGFAGSWKYKPRGHHMFDQLEVVNQLASFPMVDVFVAHNSPAGIHERDTDVHQGFEAFRAYIERCKPRYFLHGHQHVNQITEVSGTTVMGIFGERVINLDLVR